MYIRIYRIKNKHSTKNKEKKYKYVIANLVKQRMKQPFYIRNFFETNKTITINQTT